MSKRCGQQSSKTRNTSAITSVGVPSEQSTVRAADAADSGQEAGTRALETLEHLTTCTETSQFQEKLTAFVESRENASDRQSEILRSLTEAIVTHSAKPSVSAPEVETLLAELHDRLAGTFHATLRAALGGAISASTVEAPSEDSCSPSGRNSAAVTVNAEPMVSRGQTWAEIRSSFMDETDSPDRNAAAPKHPSRDRLPPGATAGSRSASKLGVTVSEFELPLEIPEFGDLQAMSADELRQTLHTRESFLCRLIGQLRRLTQQPSQSLTIEQLRAMAAEFPAELATRVSRTLQQLDEQLRLGELELSLERARVARQAAQLEFSRQQIERNARQLGWSIQPDGSIATNTATIAKAATPRRWLGKLGFGE